MPHSPSTVLIFNPNAGSAVQIEGIQDMLTQRLGWKLWRTQHEGHARELAKRAREQHITRVVGAGGDGTLNEIVNGLYDGYSCAGIEFGVLPFGTGNDLARALNIPPDPMDAIAQIERGVVTAVDLIELNCDGKASYAVNAANGGNAQLTHDLIDEDVKRRWGPLAYLLAAFQAVNELETYHVKVTWPDGLITTTEVFGMVVANGSTLGGGLAVAPNADPSDGMLDVVMVKARAPSSRAPALACSTRSPMSPTTTP